MKKFIKWMGIVVGGLSGLTILAGLVLYPIGLGKLTQTYPNIAVEKVNIPTDAVAVARGRVIEARWFIILTPSGPPPKSGVWPMPRASATATMMSLFRSPCEISASSRWSLRCSLTLKPGAKLRSIIRWPCSSSSRRF